MKNIFILTIILSFSMYNLNGQTILLEENFNSCYNWGPFPPDNWTVSERAQDYATDSFYVNTDEYPHVAKHWYGSTDEVQAGGDLCELVLNNYPYSESGMYRLISPVINASGNTSLNLSFKHKCSRDPDHDNDSFVIGVATTTDGGTTWNEVWNSGTVDATIGPELKSITINNADVNSSTFQFCLFFDGDFYVLGDWRIDDIVLASPVQNDISVSSILGEDQYAVNDFYTPMALVQNLGIVDQTFDIECKIVDFETGVEVYDNTQNITMSAGDDGNISFPDFNIPEEGKVYQVEVVSLLATDEVASNNSSQKSINSWSIQKQNVLLELSTYVTCAACPTAALGATTINEDYNVSVIEHHTSSDPAPFLYTTPDAQARLSYFGSSGAPCAWFDIHIDKSGGCPSMNCIDEYLPKYNEAMSIKTPILITVEANHTSTPDVYDVTLTVNKEQIVSKDDLRLMLVLTESHIPENWSTVEPILTELDFVNRVMYPDVNGTTIDLVNNNQIVQHYTVDASGYNYTLELVAWVEDHENRYVYQTQEFLLENAGTVGIEHINRDEISIYPNPCSKVLNIKSDNIDNGYYRISNILGLTLLEGKLTNGNSRIDISTLPNGNYFISLDQTVMKFTVNK